MKKIKLVPFTGACLVAILGVAYLNTGWATSVEDKVKDWIEDGSEALKKGVSELGDDFNAIQDYLNNYHWKGLVEDKASSGAVTLKHLKLNGHSKAVVVKPGEEIEAEVKCSFDKEKCSILGVYRVVMGIKDQGPQTTIGNESGLIAGKTKEKFTLLAPSEPGMYQIRFRTVDAVFKSTALDAWKDHKGNEPDGKTTIGLIFVK